MAIDGFSHASNVIRFPVETVGRPTLELMRELAPDLRTVEMLATTFGLELPDIDFRDQVDAEAAEYILNNIDAAPGARRSQALDALLEPVVKAAVEAARVSRRAQAHVDEGYHHLARAKREGGYWLPPLEERLETQEHRLAELMIEAHLRTEEAEGVARAVSRGRRGEVWVPRDTTADMEALLDYEAAVRAAG